MNLHQFRFVQEAVRRKLNLTETAKALRTSQPGVSKAILELEEELGIDIFSRHGKRLRRVTEPGELVLKSVEIILREVNKLQRIGEEYAKPDAGRLSIAATHTQARYVLPSPITQLRKQFPQVQVSLHQTSPPQIVRMLLEETADVGLASEALDAAEGLVSLPCHEWQHMLLVPVTHPLARSDGLTLEQLAQEPLITYHPDYAGRPRVDQAFDLRGLAPHIVLEATDSDIIRTYVKSGMGLGIIAEMAVRDEPLGGELIARPLGHLMGRNLTHISFKKGTFLRHFVYTFAQTLSERLSRPLLEAALRGGNASYQL